MAVSSSSRFTNATVGQMQAGGNVDIYKVGSDCLFPVGQGFTRGDGAKFRYVHYGLAANRGVLVSQDLSESSLADFDDSVVSSANSTAVAGETIKPGVIGSKYVEFARFAAALTADTYAGGYLAITDDTGEGYTYRIRGNTAYGNPSSTTCRVELYQPLVASLDTTSDCSIVGNLYGNVEPATSTDDIVSGVCVRTATAGQFGWIQTGGVVGVLQDDVIPAAGEWVSLSDGTTGAIQKCGGVASPTGGEMITEPLLGYCIDPGDSGGHSIIYLTIE